LDNDYQRRGFKSYQKYLIFFSYSFCHHLHNECINKLLHYNKLHVTIFGSDGCIVIQMFFIHKKLKTLTAFWHYFLTFFSHVLLSFQGRLWDYCQICWTVSKHQEILLMWWEDIMGRWSNQTISNITAMIFCVLCKTFKRTLHSRVTSFEYFLKVSRAFDSNLSVIQKPDWLHKWIIEQMNNWMNEWTNKWINK